MAAKREKSSFLIAVMEMPETMAAIARDVWEWLVTLGRRITRCLYNLIAKTVEIRNWIYAHRSWIWAFIAIGLCLVFYFLLYLWLLSAESKMLQLSFWEESSDSARNLILAIGGLLGVIAAIVGFIFSGFRTSTQLQMTQTAIDGQVTERFTKAVEQLGHIKPPVRLGAIYALERIAKDSPRDRDVIVETLAAYIRELAPWPPRDENGRPLDEAAVEREKARTGVRPPIDIAAALTVLCRLLPDGDAMRLKVDLRHTDLRGLDAPGIDLSQMRFDRSALSRCNLRKSNLSEASLVLVDLRGSFLIAAHLNEADLRSAQLGGADLECADLSMAELRYTSMEISAGDGGTHMSGANLSDARHLTQEQINCIRFLRDNPPKNMPAGLTLPPPYDG